MGATIPISRAGGEANPASSPDSRSLVAGLPQLSAGLPWPGANLPWLVAGVPWDRAGLPWDRGVLPQLVAGLPRDRGALPWLVAGLPLGAPWPRHGLDFRRKTLHVPRIVVIRLGEEGN